LILHQGGPMRRRSILFVSAVLAITTVVSAPALAHDDDGESGGTYLALGDSIVAGTQQPLPFTSSGYVDELFDELQDEYGFDTLVNLGCPADDTREFINGDDGPNGGSLGWDLPARRGSRGPRSEPG